MENNLTEETDLVTPTPINLSITWLIFQNNSAVCFNMSIIFKPFCNRHPIPQSWGKDTVRLLWVKYLLHVLLLLLQCCVAFFLSILDHDMVRQDCTTNIINFITLSMFFKAQTLNPRLACMCRAWCIIPDSKWRMYDMICERRFYILIIMHSWKLASNGIQHAMPCTKYCGY